MSGRGSGGRAARTAGLIVAVFLFLFLSRSEIRKTVPWAVAVGLAAGVWAVAFLILRRRGI